MKKQITHLTVEEAMLKKSEIVSRLCGHGGCRLWPLAILFMSLMLQLFGSSMAFTLPLPFGYSSLSIKNLLNSVLLSSNANLAGGGRNLKSDVLEDASLITPSILNEDVRNFPASIANSSDGKESSRIFKSTNGKS
uniref:Uncharacterized protein n=1 Tax=Glossina austeni TaxID=7395 RepID=A0A1A9UTJ6_GLOAU